MLTALRKGSKSKVMQILLGLIALSFVGFFGVSGTSGRGGGNRGNCRQGLNFHHPCCRANRYCADMGYCPLNHQTASRHDRRDQRTCCRQHGYRHPRP